MDPCQQAQQIEKIGNKLDRLAEALQTLAVQKKEIQHLIEHQGDQREWLKKHEQRLQTLERQPGDSASRFVWLLYGGGISVSSGIVVGLVLLLVRGA